MAGKTGTFALGSALNDSGKIKQLNLGVIVMDDSRNACEGRKFLHMYMTRSHISHLLIVTGKEEGVTGPQGLTGPPKRTCCGLPGSARTNVLRSITVRSDLSRPHKCSLSRIRKLPPCAKESRSLCGILKASHILSHRSRKDLLQWCGMTRSVSNQKKHTQILGYF